VTEAPVTQPPVVTPAPATTTNKSYTTKGGAFLWFLLSIIVNTIISFAIANRFYKLTKKSNHVQAELRALRRDIEEKFADNIDGFAEPAFDITNTNDDYSSSNDGIKMTPASSVSSGDEPEDIYKEWEAQFGAKRAQRRAAIKAEPVVDTEESYDEDEVEEESEPRPSKKTYQPKRKSAPKQERKSVKERLAARKAEREEEIDDEIDEEIEEGIAGKVGGKAKKLLGGLFPFDEGEDEE
jgi:hypothetical protein